MLQNVRPRCRLVIGPNAAYLYGGGGMQTLNVDSR